ncbi:MAG: DHH family phosphoesterase [Prevotella sp.]|nr:DHH family phosphoesterase [Bacteroides sp.]MCM1365842.1 DHH family phosphoesterase [Prevotella sp.]MCM1436466.1 DHH family phosphoesterase [Prevotella sp.]
MLTKILKESEIKRFNELLDKSRCVVLTCHVRPDGDAVGSTLGMAHLLRHLGKDVHVVSPDLPPRSLSFLPGYKDIVAYSKYPDYAVRIVNDCDLMICCDFNCIKRLDDFGDVVSQSNCKKVLIDHHVEPEFFCDLTFSFPEMSSTCELMFRIIAALGYYSEMGLDSATSLCTGLITDTQNFTVNCNNPEIYEVLMKLLDKGVDKPRIVRKALRVKTLDCFRLQAYAWAEKLELHCNQRVAIVTINAEELDRFNYVKGDSEGIVDRPLDIDTVIASFFLREDSDCIKVSARSIGDFPVNEICKNLYGGGGHLMAAGGEFKEGSLEQCRQLLIDVLPNYKEALRNATERVR